MAISWITLCTPPLLGVIVWPLVRLASCRAARLHQQSLLLFSRQRLHQLQV